MIWVLCLVAGHVIQLALENWMAWWHMSKGK